MTLLASSPMGRALLHGAVSALRPFRFALGFSTRIPRPIHVLLAL